jgi:hypothetical protein
MLRVLSRPVTDVGTLAPALAAPAGRRMTAECRRHRQPYTRSAGWSKFLQAGDQPSTAPPARGGEGGRLVQACVTLPHLVLKDLVVALEFTDELVYARLAAGTDRDVPLAVSALAMARDTARIMRW